MARTENIQTNSIGDEYSWTGPGANGTDPGMRLYVRAQIVDEMVSMSEVVAQRRDVLHGSFRVAAKIPSVNGTCAAFFWYHDDTQEIDIEFLTKELDPAQSPVNLILQSPQSQAAGYDASHTPNFRVLPLGFRPDEDYHEYRFNWTPGLVSFYADGKWLQDMTADVPDQPGSIHLNHWSNGNPGWSAGPPEEDAVMTVSYVKAYFNSTDPERRGAYGQRCPAVSSARSLCRIPDQTVPPSPNGPDGNRTANTYFFTRQRNQTEGQVVDDDRSGDQEAAAGPRATAQSATAIFAPLIAIFLVLAS